MNVTRNELNKSSVFTVLADEQCDEHDRHLLRRVERTISPTSFAECFRDEPRFVIFDDTDPDKAAFLLNQEDDHVYSIAVIFSDEFSDYAGVPAYVVHVDCNECMRMIL